ncbi:Gfo/Idh/MocA family protein [Micromonospora endolithica]|uniref:Gfo/Idh/MocA family oxidoreductase n=1 Tax=Micromonospora endolithica TaxID=230091 RepID=A0A3A9YYU6_9ACTN|nr:Gfo/Idh/MocA family oxidoreductase [Micromonospora endolithica]RKN41050.1 gfo/Idh/MocA family oxidoreductase [Micromonospora endolithica]TWJ24271.1 putative dehydrogenase [Micromonospora endolithica]
MGRTLRGLMVGAGYFAPIQLAAWRDVSGAEIVGLVGHRDPERVASVAHDASVGWSGVDLEAAIEQLRPDFLDICTPPATHGDLVRRAVARGLPVLCQKPLAPTVTEAAELAEFAQRHRVPLVVNENWRWQPWYREAKRLIDDGAIGRPFHTTMRMRPGDGWGEHPYPDQPYFATMPRLVLFETGVHYVDTARFLFGEIEQVQCVTATVNPAVAGEDLVVAVLHTTRGGIVVYDADRSAVAETVRSPAYGTMSVEGTEGTLQVADDGTMTLLRRGGRVVPHDYRIPPGWKGGCAVAAQQHFVDVLLGEAAAETPAAEYVRTMRVVEACYLSAGQARAVRLRPDLGRAGAPDLADEGLL